MYRKTTHLPTNHDNKTFYCITMRFHTLFNRHEKLIIFRICKGFSTEKPPKSVIPHKLLMINL